MEMFSQEGLLYDTKAHRCRKNRTGLKCKGDMYTYGSDMYIYLLHMHVAQLNK